jgi:hypothetical protein
MPAVRRVVLAGLASLMGGACGGATETPPPSVVIAPAALQIKNHRTAQLHATVTGSSAAARFDSRDSNIASTTDSGLVTGRAPGTTWVVATAAGARDSIAVLVMPAGPIILTLTPVALDLAIGATATVTGQVTQDADLITDTPITFHLVNPAVATATSAGTVSAIGSGVAWLVAQAGTLKDSARVVVYRPFAGKLQPRITVSPDGAWGIALSSANVMYVTQPLSNTVARFNLPGFVPAGTVIVRKTPVEVLFTPGGQTAFVACTDMAELSLVNVAAGASATFAINDIPLRLLLSLDQSRLLMTTSNGLLREFDAATGAPLASHAIGAGSLNGLVMSPDGSRLYITGYNSGRVYEYTFANGQVRDNYVGPTLQDVAVAQDNSELYVATESGQIRIISTATLAPADSINVSRGFGLRVTPDGRFLVYTQPFHILIIDRLARRVVQDFPVHPSPRRIAFDAASGSILVASDSGFVEVIH